MANVITQFLIGIGYDYDDKGERQAKAGMEAIKSSSLAIGSAIAAAAIGAGVRVDQLAEKSRKLQDNLYRTNTPTTWVQGYQASLRQLGQDADTAGGRVVDIERQLAAIKMGDRGFLDELGRAGFDTSALSQARSAQDFITQAAEQFSRATHTQQVNMASVLGLTDQEFKLWQQGGKYVEDHSKELADQLGYRDALNQKQYEYSQSWVELNLELDKAGNTISNIMLPGMTDLVNRAKDFVGTINTFAGNNPEETTAAISGASITAGGYGIASIGALAGKLGLPGAGILRSAGPLGLAAGASVASEPRIDKGLNSMFGGSEYFQGLRTAQTWGDFGNALIGNYKLSPDAQKYVEANQSQSFSAGYGSPEYLSNPTWGAPYGPYSMPTGNNNEQQGRAVAQALREAPIRVDSKLTMTGTVELDGQKLGDIVDTRIDEHNQQALPNFDTQVNR